ncbi:MAG: MotA/TolQ/ExbB proton channel family protein [Planctomycetota bacterium]|nr:MotA/TolQ/ExbB proton channel family protein [Planctomycetota bacterium]
MVASVIAGLMPTLIGMVAAFHAAANDGEAVSTEQLAESVGGAMVWTAIFLPVAVIGVAVLIMGLVMRPKFRLDDAR